MPTPALFTRMSRPPNRWTAAPIAVSTSAYRRTSARLVSTPSGATRSSFSRASARCESLRPVIATLAPCAASACAMAKTIPREPPVTTATFPLSVCMDHHITGSPHGADRCRSFRGPRTTISHRMREVAIVGAGELGGLVAHALARRNAADVVRLIDDAGNIAEGKALDISQAAPVEGFATIVSGSTGLSAAAGAGVVVIADRADHPGGPRNPERHEWHGDEALALIRQLNAIAPRAFFLCSDVSHRDLVERSVRELHISRSRILGSASEAFVAA